MEWYVCRYEQTGNMVILPDFYVQELFMASYVYDVSILKVFKKSELALDYLVELIYAEGLINKALQ